MNQNPNEAGLASYAARSADSRGRVHDEPADPLRDAFGRDRHRVSTCAAFRRLEYKTQVFVTLEDDHFRTRLTHTLEVANIAGLLAKHLQVNTVLAEVISLAHDLGHPPFGHAGEVALRNLMADQGGFEHNMHSLRVVDYLEHPYPPFRGLNLTFETREGLVKHISKYDHPEEGEHAGANVEDLFAGGPSLSVEGQISCIADRLAYDCHDLEDAFAAGLVRQEDLPELGLWRRWGEDVQKRFADRPLFAVRRPMLEAMLNGLIADAKTESQRLLAALNPQSVNDVRRHNAAVVGFSPETEAMLNELETFLLERVYRNHRLVRMDAKAHRIVEGLFHAYVDNPRMLPPRFARRIDEQGKYRVVCDYIAGMTDRFCQDDYKRLFEPFERV